MYRWSNIKQNRVNYVRAKTGRSFNIALMAPALAILERCQNLSNAHPDDFIFPILDRGRHLTAVQIDNRIHKMTRCINKSLKEIALLSDLDVPLTIYVTRHTYATLLKESGVPISVKSEAMGHESEIITQTYLKSFENEEIDLVNKHLF